MNKIKFLNSCGNKNIYLDKIKSSTPYYECLFDFSNLYNIQPYTVLKMLCI